MMSAASSASSISRQRGQRHGRLSVGTAGWTSDSWRRGSNSFYPPGTKSTGEAKLDAYQGHLRSVENNGTCHSMPSRDHVLKWKSHCAKDFTMAVKMVKTVTHDPSITGTFDDHNAAVWERLQTFVRNVAGLGNNLGPILLQFPRTTPVTPAMLRNIHKVFCEKEQKRRGDDEQETGREGTKDRSSAPPLRIAVEIRHRDSIRNDDFIKVLQELKWCLVMHPNSVGRSTVAREDRDGKKSRSYELERIDADRWPVTTGDWAYVRLHGSNDEHQGRYSDNELMAQAVPAIVQWIRRGIDAYAYVLCDDDSAGMAHSAKALDRLCHRELGVSTPRAPKQQARSIASYFGAKKRKDTTPSASELPAAGNLKNATGNDESSADGNKRRKVQKLK